MYSSIFAVGGPEFAQLLASDVLSVMAHGATRPLVRKKAAFCLLRMFRKNPNDSLLSSDEWGVKMATLLEENDIGVLLGLTSLLLGIVSRNYEGYEPCVPKLVEILERLRDRDVPQDYTYYGIPTPWLQVKILRTLQYFPAPENPSVLKNLRNVLKEILSGNDAVKNPNKNNAVNAIFFEAAGAAVSIGDEELTPTVVDLMVKFLSLRESNFRYLALENLSRLSQSYYISETIGKHMKKIIDCMSDPDSSITGGSLNLLFTTANQETAPEIVEELLLSMRCADVSLHEEMVLKAAILAERFPVSSDWYVGIMLRLILSAGNATSNEIWHSVLHLISSKEELHGLAVQKVMVMFRDEIVNESFIKCAAYILGEYGGSDEEEIREQFNALDHYYPSASTYTRAMLLNCYEKMRFRCQTGSDLVSQIDNIMDLESRSIDSEVQQRANEYKALGSIPEASNIALKALPLWELKNSVLLRKLAGKEAFNEEIRDQPAWISSETSTADGVESSNTSSQLNINPNVVVTNQTVPESPEIVDLLLFDENTSIDNEKVANSEDPMPMNEQIIENPLFSDEEQKDKVVSTEPIGNLSNWRVALYSSPSGILYEDSNIQIGIKMRGNGPSLDADFYLGNKSKGVLDIKKLAIAPVQCFSTNCSEPPSQIQTGQQILFRTSWTCLLPYKNLPEIQVQYINYNGESLARSLELPITCNKFCKPVTIPREIFIKRWNQVTGDPFKLTEDVHIIEKMDKLMLQSLLENLNMEIIDVNLKAPSVSAVSIFHCDAGKVKQVPCMVSIRDVAEQTEIPTGMDLNVSVATADAAVTLSLMNVLKAILEKL